MNFKKDKRNILILTLFFIIYYFSITRFGQYIYGSVLDWNCQHYLIPDYFRKLFYETGNLLPSFAFNLGAGENIYNLSYYGLLSPIILISYLLPFIPMKTYIQISSLILVYVSIILFYKWISKKFDYKISMISTLLFMFATPLFFHSHRHIMFINYMPFLIMGLIGVDKYFNEQKKSLLSLSVFLIIMCSYFFSVGAIASIVIYGIYVYFKKNKDVTIKSFIIDGFKFLMPIIVGILMSSVLILPTFSALLNGRGESSVSIDYLKLFIPSLNNNYILYHTYSLGLTSIAIFSLVYSVINFKREKRFLGIILSVMIVFPIFVFILNGGMYLSAKVLIPFLPIFVFVISITLDDIFKRGNIPWKIIVVFAVLCVVSLLNSYSKIFLFDVVITLLILILFNLTKKEKFINLIIIISFVLFVISNFSDSLVEKDFSYDVPSTKELVEYIQEYDKGIYRISNRNGGLGTANDVINARYYQNSIYSSLSNQNYQNFYYNLIGNDILNRSKGQLSNPKNLLFNVYMGNKYMIGGNYQELGYKKVKNIDNNFLYKNDKVLPIGYSSSKIMSKEDFDKLEYPYNAEALLNYVIVDNEKTNIDYNTNIEEISLNYNISSKRNIEISKENDYILITSDKNGSLTLDLEDKLSNKILFIKFELLDSNSCSIGDNLISINNVINKLTCKSWKYNNGNYSFEYTISNKNINQLDIKFDKGSYKIKNIETYILDYDDFVGSYSDVEPFEIDVSKTKADVIEGNINSSVDGYFNLSVPYDKGFSIYVDGEKIEYEKTDLAFIGFQMQKGNHHIKIVYTSPLLNVSKVISLVGITIFISVLCIEQRKKCKTVSK